MTHVAAATRRIIHDLESEVLSGCGFVDLGGALDKTPYDSNRFTSGALDTQRCKINPGDGTDSTYARADVAGQVPGGGCRAMLPLRIRTRLQEGPNPT